MSKTFQVFFNYSGGSASSVGAASPSITGTSGSHAYWTFYIEVSILYGTYIDSNTTAVHAPGNLPALPNIPFNINVYGSVGNTTPGVPTFKDSTPKFIGRQNIFDVGNEDHCLGTKFVFMSRIYPAGAADYCAVWSTPTITIPYGAAAIVIPPQSGITPAFTA